MQTAAATLAFNFFFYFLLVCCLCDSLIRQTGNRRLEIKRSQMRFD